MKKTTIIIIVFLTSFTCLAQWNNIYIDSTYYELRDLHFFDKDTGFACGYIMHGEGAILRTYDGGENWQNTNSDIMVCTSIDFVSDLVGFSGGQDGAVYKTIDGGISWEYISSLQPSYDYEDMEFLSDSIGFVKAYYGPLYKTNDGAQTWNPVTPNINSFFGYGKNHSIHFIDDSIGFVVGYSAIFKTIDQGDSWSQKNADSGYYYRSINMINKTEGFAVGNDGILVHTIDGGENWAIDSISDKDLLEIKFISDSVGFVIGNGGHSFINPDTMGVILETNDKGTTWEETMVCGHTISAFYYVDSMAYIVGNYGYIFKNYNLLNLADIVNFGNHFNETIVWPNPARNDLFFSFPDQKCYEVSLIDNGGKIIYKNSNYRKKTINISEIPAGIYFLKISCDNNFYINKVIIHK